MSTLIAIASPVSEYGCQQKDAHTDRRTIEVDQFNLFQSKTLKTKMNATFHITADYDLLYNIAVAEFMPPSIYEVMNSNPHRCRHAMLNQLGVQERLLTLHKKNKSAKS